MSNPSDSSVETTTATTDGSIYIKLDEDEVEVKEGTDSTDEEQKFGFFEIGPTSFAELDEVREAAKEDMSIKAVMADFMAIVGNIMSFPSENGKTADLRELVKEMEDRLPEEPPKDASEKGAEIEDNTTEMKSNGLFTIWKDEATGKYQWLGVYSNKFRDDDSPIAEILAEDAHLRFIERVEKGELAYPDLYVWHIPSPIGKANLLAYDDAGFSIASGEIEEDFAIAFQNTSEDLAMSHGMPSSEVRRDKSDPTVITDYVSTEISVLPRWAAANKMTDFYVLNEEEVKMAIIPNDKRQQVADLLGEDLTDQLEVSLASRSDKAIVDGVEFKEEDQPTEEAAEETETEGTEMKTEAVEEEKVDTAEEQVAEAEDEADESESVEETEESVEEVEEPVSEPEVDAAVEEAANEEPVLRKSEVAEALAFVVEAMTAQNKQLAESILALSERVDALSENGIDEKSTEAQLAELAASTPEASLQAMLAERLASAGSVIGNPATYVHGNSALAKEGPEQAPEEAVEEGESGLFFNNWN
jgi:hypothetical protein